LRSPLESAAHHPRPGPGAASRGCYINSHAMRYAARFGRGVFPRGEYFCEAACYSRLDLHFSGGPKGDQRSPWVRPFPSCGGKKMRARSWLVGLVAAPLLAVSSPASASGNGLSLSSENWHAVVARQMKPACGSTIRGPFPVQVQKVTVSHPAPGVQLAMVLARCAGAGGAPSGLYVYDRALTNTRAHLLQVLLAPSLDRQANSVTTDGASVTMQEAGYSSSDVPRSAPDLHYEEVWIWTDQRYRAR
jgi:hypothetical protein